MAKLIYTIASEQVTIAYFSISSDDINPNSLFDKYEFFVLNESEKVIFHSGIFSKILEDENEIYIFIKEYFDSFNPNEFFEIREFKIFLDNDFKFAWKPLKN